MTTCSECGAILLVNTTKIKELGLFCPNDRCSLFAVEYWVER